MKSCLDSFKTFPQILLKLETSLGLTTKSRLFSKSTTLKSKFSQIGLPIWDRRRMLNIFKTD